MRSGSRLFGVALVAAAWVLGGEPQPRALAIDGATQWSVNGHWYKYIKGGSDWDSAKTNAEALGGHLATLTSAEEQAWVYTTLNVATQGGCWIGGNDIAVDGTWVWVTGEPWAYANWDAGEPNNWNGNVECWLEMKSYGNWNDSHDTFKGGYIVEWSTAPPPPPSDPPAAPSGLTASVSYGNPILLAWTDNSNNEEAFEIERSESGGAFGFFVELGPNSTTMEDVATIPGATYTYRVRAKNAAGPSDYTNEATVKASSLAPSPKAPTEFRVLSSTRDRLEFWWVDNSVDEVGFEVHRRPPGGEFEFVASTSSNSWSFTHENLTPDGGWIYGVRAVNAFRTSGFAEVSASTLPTLSVTALRADLKDSPKFGKDSLKVQALFDFLPASPDALFDPLAEGITLRAGDDAHPVVMTLPGGLDTWKVKGTKAIWKSAKGSIPKYMVQVDLEDRLVKASATGLELAAPPANPMRVSVGIGNDAGTVRGDWETKKPGTFRLR